MLLAFAGEGVYVEGFYAVAKFYKAEGVVTFSARQAAASVGVVWLCGWRLRKSA